MYTMLVPLALWTFFNLDASNLLLLDYNLKKSNCIAKRHKTHLSHNSLYFKFNIYSYR